MMKNYRAVQTSKAAASEQSEVAAHCNSAVMRLTGANMLTVKAQTRALGEVQKSPSWGFGSMVVVLQSAGGTVICADKRLTQLSLSGISVQDDAKKILQVGQRGGLFALGMIDFREPGTGRPLLSIPSVAQLRLTVATAQGAVITDFEILSFLGNHLLERLRPVLSLLDEGELRSLVEWAAEDDGWLFELGVFSTDVNTGDKVFRLVFTLSLSDSGDGVSLNWKYADGSGISFVLGAEHTIKELTRGSSKEFQQYRAEAIIAEGNHVWTQTPPPLLDIKKCVAYARRLIEIASEREPRKISSVSEISPKSDCLLLTRGEVQWQWDN